MRQSQNNVVVLVAQHFSFPHETGGLRPFRIANALTECGFTVHVLAGTGEYAARKSTVRCGGSLSFTVERLWAPYSQEMGEVGRIFSFLWFALASTLRVIKLRPSMVYASSTPLLVGIPAAVSKTLLKSRMIFEVRDLWPDVPIALGFLRNRPMKWIAHWLESYFYRRADSIFGLSPDMVHHVNRSLKSTKPVHLLPNISDFEFFAQASKPTTEERAQREYPISNFIVYTGSFGHTNGTDYLPSVAKGLAEKGLNTSVVAVGQGSHFEKTRAFAQELGVLGVSYFQLDPIAAKDVPALLARADAMISVFAGFRCLEMNGANKFFDGLAAGLPIIINYGGWQSAVVRDNNLGLVLGNPLTEDDLVTLTEFLKNQRASAHARSAAGKVARSYFSRQRFEEHLQVAIEPYRRSGKESLLKKPAQLCSHPTCRDFLQ